MSRAEAAAAAAEAERASRAERAERAERAAARTLEFALRIGERLLASGEGAADVEDAMRVVLRAYRLPEVEPQVTFTMISLSRQAGAHGAPVTVGRTVRERAPDYQLMTAVHRLIDRVEAGLGLDEAAACLAAVDRGPRPYPRWLARLAPGALAASASLLVSGRADGKAWITFAVAFLAAVAGALGAEYLAKAGLSAFFSTVAAAVPASAAGVVMALSGAGLGGSAVVTGSLFATFPGRTLVGAIEDGLTGFYLTAVARLLEVVFTIAGTILGVLAILPAGVRLGAAFKPEGGIEHTLAAPPVQIPAAAVLALTLGIIVRTPRRVLPVIVLGGALAWIVFDLLARYGEVNPIAATGIAAAAAALIGQIASRFRYRCALPYITGALCPLLPGSLLYTGVLYLGQGKVVAGLADLSRAGATALALAVGVAITAEATALARNRRTPRPPASGRAEEPLPAE